MFLSHRDWLCTLRAECLIGGEKKEAVDAQRKSGATTTTTTNIKLNGESLSQRRGKSESTLTSALYTVDSQYSVAAFYFHIREPQMATFPQHPASFSRTSKETTVGAATNSQSFTASPLFSSLYPLS